MLDIEKIEQKYNKELSSLKYKDFFIWGYLRGIYGSYTLYKQRKMIDNSGKNKLSISKKIILLNVLKNMFYGFKNWFRRYDYIVFGDTDSFKDIDGKYIDRMTHKLMQELNEDKILYIESKNKEQYYPLNSSNYYRVSDYIFFILSRVITLFRNNHLKYDLLDKINKEFNIIINYEKEIIKFESEYIIYQLFLKIYKPKIVIVTCFTKRSFIKAANDLNIITVEFQHGGIANNYGYNTPLKNDYSFQSKYLLVYGFNDKKLFNQYNYLKNKNNIFAVGNYYLESLIEKKVKLDDNSQNYTYKVIVSLQTPVAERMINFIVNISDSLNDFLFILIPRVENNLKYLKVKRNNIKVYKEYNCYEIASCCNIHISAYSTCLLEVPAFGLINIFINFSNNSEYYFKEYIEQKSYNFLINNEYDVILFLKNIQLPKKESIREEHKDYIAIKNYSEFYLFSKQLKKDIDAN